MSSNGAVFPPPSPPFTTAQQQTTFPETTPSSSSASSSSPDDDSFSPSIVITALVLATAIIFSASIYLLLRCIRSRCRHRRRNRSNSQISASSSDGRNHRQGRVAPEEIDTSLADSLPIFTFASLSGGGGGSNNNGDCAVCLSKFEPQDRLRLLPACCHAFHADCIDAWLVTNQTCPLCRSSIFLSDADLINKTLLASSFSAPGAASSRSGSFRVEIGSVSRRQQLPSDFTGTGTGRSYSIGSFDYVIDDDDNHATLVSDVAAASARTVPSDKIDQTEIAVAPGESVAAGVGGRTTTSWLKEYVDRLGWTAAASSFSLSSSLRSSGRFFGGGIGLGIGSTSSRRTETPRVQDSDLEASRLGDDIGEMFRWLSGV